MTRQDCDVFLSSQNQDHNGDKCTKSIMKQNTEILVAVKI